MAKTTALAKVPTTGTAVATIKKSLVTLADRLGGKLTVPQASDILTELNTLSAVVESLAKVAKEKLKLVVLQDGEVATDAGTRRLERDGWRLEVRPYRTGLDSRKVEKLLRAKQAPLDKYMNTKVTYEVDSDKLLSAVEAGVFTQDELNTCKYDENWVLQSPKRVTDDE